MNTTSPLAGLPSAAAVLRNPSSARPEPPLPDEIANPTTKPHLLAKIDVVLKTASRVQHEALVTLKQIVTEQLHDAMNEEANCNYYDRLVNQVICGERTKATLGDTINGVNGLYQVILVAYGCPLPCVNTDPPKVPQKPRFVGWVR